MKEIAFNINMRVKVKLTPQGKKRYLAYFEEAAEMFSRTSIELGQDTRNRARQRANAEWLEGQLWELMHIFGPAMTMGQDNVFMHNYIVIDVEDEHGKPVEQYVHDVLVRSLADGPNIRE